VRARPNPPIAASRRVPSDERVRLRARLIAEEFFETLEAMFRLGVYEDDVVTGPMYDNAKIGVLRAIERAEVDVLMTDLVDGLADLDYVIEGTRLEFGVNGAPVAAEVHRSNMAKVGGEVRPDGKILKPKGWTPPDIDGELRKQGWKP